MILPVARPLQALSPSAFGDLRACQLRVAFKQQADRAAGKTDAQIVGDAVHEALAAFIAAGEFVDDDAVELARARFNAVLGQHSQGYEIRGARPSAARLAKIVGRVLELLENAGPNAVVLTETYLRARQGMLHGVVDLIIESEPLHAIVDYKTGRTTDEQGEVSEHFQVQLQFYAVLEHERSGSWPNRGVLLRFGGPPIPIDLDPTQCTATADLAVEILTAYNALADTVPPATPGEEVCRFCPFAPVCPSFWETLTPTWERGAVRGRVAWLQPSETGGLTLALDGASGSFEGTVAIRRLPERALAGRELTVGTELRVCGVRPDSDGRLIPDGSVRAAIFDVAG
jgi:CRISPR/Cas system-associated exonuclease Cas4 (RecB family)